MWTVPFRRLARQEWATWIAAKDGNLSEDVSAQADLGAKNLGPWTADADGRFELLLGAALVFGEEMDKPADLLCW